MTISALEFEKSLQENESSPVVAKREAYLAKLNAMECPRGFKYLAI